MYKRLWNLSYVRHNRLTFYVLRRTMSKFSVSNFHDCVTKVMTVSKKADFCFVAGPFFRPIAYSSKSHFLLNKWKIYRSYNVGLNEFWAFSIVGDSTWPKPNQDLGYWDALDVSVSDKNVTSLLDACLHATAQKRMVYVIPCTFSKSYYEPILIHNSSVDWEGWSTSHFHLRQARWFQFPHHKLSVPE